MASYPLALIRTEQEELASSLPFDCCLVRKELASYPLALIRTEQEDS